MRVVTSSPIVLAASVFARRQPSPFSPTCLAREPAHAVNARIEEPMRRPQAGRQSYHTGTRTDADRLGKAMVKPVVKALGARASRRAGAGACIHQFLGPTVQLWSSSDMQSELGRSRRGALGRVTAGTELQGRGAVASRPHDGVVL